MLVEEERDGDGQEEQRRMTVLHLQMPLLTDLAYSAPGLSQYKVSALSSWCDLVWKDPSSPAQVHADSHC